MKCNRYIQLINILRFIIVEEISDERYLERIYNIGDVKPIITRMIFEEKEYALLLPVGVEVDEDSDESEMVLMRLVKDGEDYTIPPYFVHALSHPHR